jgi:uncharacterized membrane protein
MAKHSWSSNKEIRVAAVNAAVQVATYINHQIDTEEAVLKRFAEAYVAIIGIIDDPEAALGDSEESGETN